MAPNTTAATRHILAGTTTTVLSRPIPQYYIYTDPVFYQHLADEAFGGIIPFLGRMIRLAFLSVLLLTLSAVSYGCFYVAVMPTMSTTAPLYFDYSGTQPPRSSEQKYHRYSSSFSQSTKIDGSSTSLPSPWATVDLFAKHSGTWKAGTGISEVLPPPLTSHNQHHHHQQQQQQLLIPRQAYYLEISLQLPESTLNRQAGMFGIAVELQSCNKTTLATSHRATRFPHQSEWIRVLQKLVCLLPLLIGALDESRTVVVPSFRHYVESSKHPLQHVQVKLVPPPAAQTLVEVTSGELRIGKELNAFQEVLKTYYFTCYSIGTAAFAVLYMFVWTVILPLVSERMRMGMRNDDDEEPPCDLDLDDLDNIDDDYYLFEDASAFEEVLGDEHRNGVFRNNQNRTRQAANNDVDCPTDDAQEMESDDGLWEDLFPNGNNERSSAASIIVPDEGTASSQQID